MQPDLTLPEYDDPPRHYRLEISKAGKNWITANQRLNRFARARLTRNWRDITAWRARNLVPAPIPYGYVVCELRFADKRRRDPANWAPTAKAAVDGLVDAMVFTDDSSDHVIGPDLRLGPVSMYESLVVHIWPRQRRG